MGRRETRVFIALAIASLALGCSQPQAQPAPAHPTNAPAPESGGLPRLAPLTAAPGGATAVAPPVSPRPPAPGTRQLDVVVQGDATRIVYPASTLTAGQLYPAIVFAHGHGMDQGQLTERTGLADAAAHEGWLSAAGLFSGRAHWGNDVALRAVGNLVAELVAHHQADPKRIYLVGFSMGGGTMLLAAENRLNLPYRAAAVVSTQGFTDLKGMTMSDAGGGAYTGSILDAYNLTTLDDATAALHSPQSQAESLTGMPVYLEHGEADASVPVAQTRQMAAKLAALGIAAEVHTYPGMGHGESTIHEDTIISFLRGKVSD